MVPSVFHLVQNESEKVIFTLHGGLMFPEINYAFREDKLHKSGRFFREDVRKLVITA